MTYAVTAQLLMVEILIFGQKVLSFFNLCNLITKSDPAWMNDHQAKWLVSRQIKVFTER